MNEPYMLIRDFCRVAGITYQTFGRWKERGLAPPQRGPGRSILIEDYQAWAEKRDAHRVLLGDPGLKSPATEGPGEGLRPRPDDPGRLPLPVRVPVPVPGGQGEGDRRSGVGGRRSRGGGACCQTSALSWSGRTWNGFAAAVRSS
jgi:hypothetical protein